jgi:hypothetical protein
MTWSWNPFNAEILIQDLKKIIGIWIPRLSLTNTNTNNLVPPFPMRYNKMQNISTALNNKAQLKVFLSSS